MPEFKFKKYYENPENQKSEKLSPMKELEKYAIDLKNNLEKWPIDPTEEDPEGAEKQEALTKKLMKKYEKKINEMTKEAEKAEKVKEAKEARKAENPHKEGTLRTKSPR